MKPTLSALLLPALLLFVVPLRAEVQGALPAGFPVQPQQVTEWKSVFAQVETRDRLPARARIGGTLVMLSVRAGDEVRAGAVIARVEDEKLGFQLAAHAARRAALEAQRENARAEVARAEALLARGAGTLQRLDQLRTEVDVLSGQIAAVAAEARLVEAQAAEGAILAPIDGRVLAVPLATGAVIQPGEAVAQIGGGGILLRLQVPERLGPGLAEGAVIAIEGTEAGLTVPAAGRIERIWPLIEEGRVSADVALEGLPARFIGARVLVRLATGSRPALVIPAQAVETRAGVDFVRLIGPEGARLRSIVPGARLEGGAMVEVLSGLQPGDRIALPGEAGDE